jgi:hypothetical protein
MELLGDVGHLESCFGPFRYGVSVGATQVHGLGQTYHTMGLLGDVGHVESCVGMFGDSVKVGAR